MSEVHVKGLAALQKVLDQVAPKIERNILRGALREGAKVTLAEAIYRAPSQTGELVASLKIGTKARGGTVTASVKTNVFYAKFIEFGTKPHEIVAKPGKSLFLGNTFVGSVEHPGIKPRPFMRPALDATASSATVAAAEYMKRRLQDKHSLDTSHITIEGDES